MKKSRLDENIIKVEDDFAQNESLAKVGTFLSQEQVKSAEIANLNRPKPGSFGEIASNIVNETMGLFTGQSTLSRISSGQPVGRLFYYKGALLVKTPFKTIVGAQVYIEALQERLFQLTSVSTEQEVDSLKRQLNTVTNGGFIDLIKLAFKRLLNKG